MKEVVKDLAPDSMDTLVQQTESPFTAESPFLKSFAPQRFIILIEYLL